MREYFLGIIVGICGTAGLLLILAAAPINNTFKDQQAIFNEFANVYAAFQPRQYRVVTTTPTSSSLVEHEVIIYKSTITPTLARFYTKLGTQTWSVDLSTP